MNIQKLVQLAQFIVSEEFHTITEDDILKQVEGKWFHKGIVLTQGQVDILKKEAKQFSESNLFKVLMDELNWHSRSKLEASQSEQDMIASKLLSYLADVLKSKIKKIANL